MNLGTAWVALMILVGLCASHALGAENRELPTVGQVYLVDAATARPYETALRAGLTTLGYAEGQNLRIISRYANGEAAQLPTLIRELVELRVDILFVSSSAVSLAKQATTEIPIICPSMGDPVEEGLVQSLARPGVNLTGLADAQIETDEKRLELAKEIVPNLRRVGVLADPIDRQKNYLEEYRKSARRARVEATVFEVRNLAEIQSALKQIEGSRIQALVVFAAPLLILHREVIMRAVAHRLPVISQGKDLAEAGALLAYSVNYHDQWRRSAAYIDKVLKGAKPAELPIEQPTKFDLLLNMRSAKALGIAPPESILVRANEIIR